MERLNRKKNLSKFRLYANRIRLICDKYNLIMKNIQPEEVPLFELKLNKIDSVKIHHIFDKIIIASFACYSR
jgi:hypothetical protein